MNIAVYCASTPGTDPSYADAARELGRWIGESGNNLVYGGSSVGLMGVVSRETLASGGRVYGVEPQFFLDAGVAQHDLTKLYVVDTMAERKAKMIELADVFVALPGGIGTLEEISEIMSCIRLGLNISECYMLNLNGFYEPLKQLLENMHTHKFIDRIDLERYFFPENVRELCDMICVDAEHPRACLVTANELTDRKNHMA